MTVRVPRIPAPGETVLGREFQITGGGKGANQAVAAARGGGRVVFVTAVGMDDLGERALEGLRREGIDIHLVRRVSGPSGVALIFVDDAGENSIAVAAGANAELRPEHVEPLEQILEPGDVVLLQLEIPMATVEATVRVAVKQQARVILNPAPAQALPDVLMQSVSLVTPNELEVEHLTGVTVKDETALTRAVDVLHGRGISTVIVTLGPRGVFASHEGRSEMVRAFRVQAVDSTAAGDVFNGALAVALVEGRTLGDAVRFGSAAGALSVTRMGAQASAPHRAEIEAFLRDI
jgi:ribokinase